MRFRSFVDVHLLLLRGESVLLGLRQNTGYGNGCWHLPAGHLEQGESLLACVVREAREELGLELDVARLRFCHLAHNAYPDGDRLQHFFAYDGAGLVPRNVEPEKCAELAWFPLETLPANIVPYAAVALVAIARGEAFACDGWPNEWDAGHSGPGVARTFGDCSEHGWYELPLGSIDHGELERGCPECLAAA